EFDPDGPVEAKVVEEVFVRVGHLMHLHVGGQVIRTTLEHPFFVRGKGWLPAGELRVGDALLGHDGRWTTVEDLLDTEGLETVYNLRIADYHTYFVGSEAWGFPVWAHNAYTGPEVGAATPEEVQSLRGLEQQAIAARETVAGTRTNNGRRTYRVGLTQ